MIELEGTRVVAHVAYVRSAGARRAALNHGAPGQRVVARLRFIRWTRRRCAGGVQVRSQPDNLIDFMFNRTLRVEAATDGRAGERKQ